MVYDEGFHVSMQAPQSADVHSFFAFMKYELADKDKKDVKTTKTEISRKHSHCAMTLLGWYKTVDSSRKSLMSEQCFWGERISDLKDVPVASLAPSPVLAPMGT